VWIQDSESTTEAESYNAKNPKAGKTTKIRHANNPEESIIVEDAPPPMAVHDFTAEHAHTKIRPYLL